MPVNATHISVDINGNIRWTGPDSGTYYTVLELHRFLQDLADDAQASGDDLIDITTDTPSDRSTDNIITLNSPFNIDDTLARYLYDGSISQNNGDDLYSGLRVLGTVVAGTEILIVQDDQVLPAYWGTGINADAANNVIMRILVKSREGGADIDGKRILCFARELGDSFQEFAVTLGLANSVAALSTTDDINNDTVDATIAGWTTIANTEGLQLIDIDNNGANEEYYHQWDKGSQSINDTYEYAKWVSQRSHVSDSNTGDSGTNYIVDNATIVGQAQSFTTPTNPSAGEKLREMRFRLKIGAGAPTGTLQAELYASTAGVIPTGAVLATSEPVLASLISSSYKEVIFRFNDNVTMSASTQYCAVIRHADGTAGAYFHVEGAASGTKAGENAAEENPASTWTAAGAADLYVVVKSSPIIHTRAGELHRGITHEVVYDTESGAFSENEILFWGTQITYDGLANGPFTVGNYVQFQPQGGGTVKNGGKILKDSGTVLWVALENIAPTVALADNDIITEIEDGTATTANINVTITDDDKAGGEGVLLALDDNGTDGDFYIQLISGSAPVDNLQIEGRTSGQTALVNVTVNGQTISPVFLGQSTGSNIIGAYGIGFQTTDVSANDLLTALDGTARNPPNNVTLTVTGLISGEDRVLVGPRTAGVLDTAQFTTDTTLSAIAETVVSIATVAIPTDTPGSGEASAENTRLRVQLNNGVFYRLPYASYDSATPGNFTLSLPANSAVQIDVNDVADTFTRASGDFLADGFEPGCTFTGANFANGGNNAQFTAETVTATVITVAVGTGLVTETGSGDETLTADGWDFTGTNYSKADNATSGNDVFVAYIDVLADGTSEAYTAVYSSDRDLFVRVRDGGATPIKTFEVEATFGSSNSSVAAIRTSDA